MFQPARIRIVITALLTAALLSGCVVRIVYNQLDWLALWYVDSYFDLNDAQEERAKALIGNTLAWHRSTQLPRYVHLSASMHDRVGEPVSADFVAGLYDEVVTLWDELLVHVGADAGMLLQTLTDRQVDRLLERLAKENRKLAEEYSGDSPGERRAKQDKAVIKAFRQFTGRLSNAQEALIRSRTAELHDLSAEWLQRRAAWQREFRELLAGRTSDPRFVPRVAGLLLDPNQFDSPAYRAQVAENQRRVFSLVAEILGTLSPAQEEHLRKRLAGYRQDFEDLVRQGAGPRQASASMEASSGSEASL